MKYRRKHGKYIFEKEGVYYAMTRDQVSEMADLCGEILGETGDIDSTGAIMGNKFEVWNWEKSHWNADYEWVNYYAGESKKDAFAELERLKADGAPCVKLEWR